MNRIGVICGGSGSSKFASAFSEHAKSCGIVSESQLGFVANVADNFWHKGLYVAPDVDIITYALCDRLDTSKGWGIASDSFVVRDSYSALDSGGDWFNLGDRDLVLSIRRTELMKRGWKLSSVTEHFRNKFGISHPIIPATDDDIQTFLRTNAGQMHQQEFWVKHRARVKVSQVIYSGLENARPNMKMLEYLSSSAIICPANPITSILPSIRLSGADQILKKSRVIAISPFVGGAPFSGPAGILMQAMGYETTSYGVAALYSGFLDTMIVEEDEDPKIIARIKEMGIECIKLKTRLSSKDDQTTFARNLFEIL